MNINDKQTRIAEAEKFFDMLYGNVTDRKFGYLWIKKDDEKKTYSFAVSNPAERKAMAIKAIELNDDGADVYYGVNLVDSALAEYQRAKHETVTVQTATITDIDVEGGTHISNDKIKYPPTFDVAKSFLPSPVSILVDSGYGMHGIDLYGKPITITDENRAQAKERNKRFISVIRDRAGIYSKAVDGIGDLARVLRVPGTRNYKLGISEDAPLCHVVEDTGLRFSPADLDQRLDHFIKIIAANAEKPARAKRKPKSDACAEPKAQSATETIGDNAEFDKWRVTKMLEVIPVKDLHNDEWFPCVTALKSLGFSYSEVDRMCQGGVHYNESENRTRWDSADVWSKDDAIGTLSNLAISYGYDPHEAYCEYCQLNPQFQAKDNRVRTRDRIKDCPANLLVPPDFILNNRGVTFVKPATERKPEAYIPAIKTPVVVTKILSGQSDGIQRYEIAIKSRGKWKFQEVDAKTLQSPRQIYDLAEYGCLIADAGLATRYFTSFIADNERDISELKVYSKPGWYDDGKRFIYPQPSENADYRVERNNIEYSTMFATRGDRNQWIEKFRNVTNRSPIHAIYFGAALAAPLLDVLGLPNFWFHINGRRNLCKTPLMKFALSTFGNPEKIMRTFNASPKHLQTMAVGLNDLPMGIDEGETMTEKALAEFQTTIYNFVAGVDGQRNQRNGDVRVTEDFRGTRISTSEQPLLRTSNKGGAYKRFIDLHLSEPLFSVTEGRDLHLFVARNHGHFGRLWTEYISAHAEEIRADFDEISNSIAEEHGEKYETAHVLSLVACSVAFWHFRLLLQLDSHFEHDLARAYANNVLKKLPTQDEIDDVKRWLELLEGYVASHPKHFWRKVILPDGTIPTETFYAPMLYGRVFEDDSVAIIAGLYPSICEDLKIPAEKFINELFERGYLIDATRKNKAKQVRIGGNKTRAYVFKEGVLWHGEWRNDAEDETITN